MTAYKINDLGRLWQLTITVVYWI